MNSNKRPIGWFTIDFREVERWQEFLPALSRFFVVRCDADYATRSFVYVAFSDLFQEIDACIAPPRYDLTFVRDDKGKVHLKSVALSPIQGGLYGR